MIWTCEKFTLRIIYIFLIQVGHLGELFCNLIEQSADTRWTCVLQVLPGLPMSVKIGAPCQNSADANSSSLVSLTPRNWPRVIFEIFA